MTAGTFLMSLEKFFAAWGIPDLILSNNAATFKSAAAHLRELKEHPEIQSYMQSNLDMEIQPELSTLVGWSL